MQYYSFLNQELSFQLNSVVLSGLIDFWTHLLRSQIMKTELLGKCTLGAIYQDCAQSKTGAQGVQTALLVKIVKNTRHAVLICRLGDLNKFFNKIFI